MGNVSSSTNSDEAAAAAEFQDIFSRLAADESWKSRTGKGVQVAVIDSGIDAAHPQLQGKVVESVEAVSEGKRVVFTPTDAGDSAGHGTACAGIITSIAPDASLYSIKVLGAGGAGDGQAFLAGLEYAIKRRIRLVNLSLGTTKPQFFAPLH
ncbi:MAG: S8 family serine peptidase, partial [Acidobacteriota bacterium]|nr:S8 family serine peptidase [Acidobacteriota bacterium]